jgi:tetratricopeptide (TPR) repeat protein
MLPLLPMHPQAVPPFSPNLESLTVGLPDGSDLASQQFLVRETRATHQHSFPIRTSRASGRSATAGALPVHASFQEHNLRRKTPNGTIDAGYDGSPTQLSPASRPLKHMILTGRVSTGHSPRNAQILPFRQTVPHTEAFLGQNHIGDDGVNRSSRPIFNNDDYSQDHARGGFDPASGRYPHWRGQQQPHIYPQNHHRHLSVYANGNNDWTFGPPPYPMNESLPFGQMKRPIGFSPWNYPNPDQASSFRTGHFSISPGAATYGEFGSDQAYQSAVSHGLLHDPMTNIRHSQHPHTAYMPLPSSTGLVAGAQDGANPAYPQFKEKVLLQAHRSYVDLLAYLQTTRKLHHGKAGSNTHPSSRLLIYPKPPKPTIKEQASFTTKICSTSTSNSSFGIGIDDIGQNQYQPSAARQISSNRPVHSSIGSGFPERTNALVRLDEPRSLPSFGVAENGYPVPLGGYISAPGSALGNARSSLQLIQNLCEQSGWKWIDGLLLAGCLQYGLEQYSNALKSFSRITALDSSHVEAIANTAATLYCLDRQQEAEQRWLDAVKLRPDYLEAAEHLVGLLYRKRSKEAVEIIDHVQQALRLPQEAWRQLGDSTLPRSGACQTAAGAYGKTALHGHGGDQDGYSTQSASDRMLSNPHETKRTGFGSSGYAIPGEDNGRILALIHAKGTMLYSLRDVARASEAFEEAVMISVGRCMSGIWDLVQRIQAVLSSSEGPLTPSPTSQSLSPLLLPPEKARLTAQLVFRGTGELPGLVHVTEGGPKRAAFQTTSNSLLSLAKIFQDSASSGATGPGKLRQPSGVGDILALYYLSLSLQESPSTANNVGILLAGVQHIVASQPTRWENALPHPSLSGIPPGSGLALALAYYHYGLRLDPKHVHLHTNLGSLLKDIGHLDLAIQMYERAVSCDGTFDIALTNLANAVKDRGRTMDAINYYRRAVSSNPNFAEAVCGLLTALNSVCDWRGRGGVILSSGKYDRWHVNDEGMLLDAHAQREGSGLTKRAVDIVRQQLEEASQWGRQTLHKDLIQSLAGELQHHCSSRNTMVEEMLQSWIGKPWEGTRLLRLIERALRVIMRKWYLDKYVLRTADDKQRYPRPRLPASLTVPSAPTVLPFHTFTTPLEAQDIRIISQRNALRISCSALRSSWLPMETYKPPPPPRPQLNVGYISSDFNNHPLAHL